MHLRQWSSRIPPLIRCDWDVLWISKGHRLDVGSLRLGDFEGKVHILTSQCTSRRLWCAWIDEYLSLSKSFVTLSDFCVTLIPNILAQLSEMDASATCRDIKCAHLSRAMELRRVQASLNCNVCDALSYRINVFRIAFSHVFRISLHVWAVIRSEIQVLIIPWITLRHISKENALISVQIRVYSFFLRVFWLIQKDAR